MMNTADLPQVLAIERDSFPSPWTRDAFLVEIRAPFGQAWVALDNRRQDRSIVGYACFWERSDQVQLVNLCVAAPYRGQGLGRLMMNFVISWSKVRRKSRLSLEVRHNNQPAIRLYRSLNFVQVGVRQDYYSDTGENALIMDLSLTPEPDLGQKAVDSDLEAG